MSVSGGTLRAVSAGTLLATLAGCETTAPRCAFTPCGGALEGQWTIKERCPAPPSECPGAKVDYGDSSLEGTFTFSSESTYVASVRQKGTIVATMPLSCYPAASGCAGVEAELRAAAGRDASSPVAEVSCSGGPVCTCRESLRDKPVIETGSYRITETRVILTSGADATTDEYCVSGSQLKLRAATAAVVTATPAGGSSDVLILTR
jgi:hypothetical protein